ncbi:HipA domain-containing protein [Arachidicoccus ginsenosidivorans]|jgi:serine/threonine-protein kinase HipA|uniref:HipA domain-containing protein n=1 Tax=Arachidicoccus ginsenosidivorans TaxID=496057 RepID=A0A5B8VQ30_9BACT|nr:HipA domain-containing protein [Arachidicoccus ginsenosidivorans]QEC72796.1 HipA domain-containing protein [Arachidicoccus ginsenosidivorans]
MICLSCYKKSAKAYCPSCRKILFKGINIPDTLNFDTPVPEIFYVDPSKKKLLSVSGMQLKYSLKLQNKELQLLVNQGEYILKPIPKYHQLEIIDDLPENEHLTMQIARQVFGLKTADNALIYFQDGRPAYLTRRFDVLDNGLKLAQEDFCQLMNRSAGVNGENFKYDSSYDEMGQIFREIGTPVTEQEAFFKQILFNYLISNGDAHLKNFSLIRADQGGYRLSPAYDLLCTRLHTRVESDVALDLFEGDMDFPYYDTYGRYGTPEFLELSARLGIKESRARRFLADFTSEQKMDQVSQMVENSFLSDSSKEKYIALLKGKRTAFD